MHPHVLCRTYVTTKLDTGVDLRTHRSPTRHAVPRRITMRSDRPRTTLDCYPDDILAAYQASGT